MSRDIILPGGDTLKLFDSAYTPSEVEAILTKALRQPRDNLLRNSYFIGGGSQQGGGQFPINQRGQTLYVGAGYGIDGWKSSLASVALASDGLDLSFNAKYAYFAQSLEYLPAGIYTFSALFNEAPSGLYVEYFVDGGVDVNLGPIGQPLCSFTFSTAVPLQNPIIAITHPVDGKVTAKAIAAKLEPGPNQTLAYQDASGNWVLNDPPPNFRQELAKCRQYYIPPSELLLNGVYVGGSFFAILPIQMRANSTPIIRTTGSIAHDGTTYSVSSVDNVLLTPYGMKFIVHISSESSPPNNSSCIWKSNSIGLNCDL